MEVSKRNQALVRLCLAAVMTALVFWGNYLRIVLPLAVGGQTAFKLANILGVLSGILLGPWWGFASTGLGAALYDLLSGNPLYASQAPLTFFVQGVYGLVAGLVMHKVFVGRLGRQRDEYVPQVLSALCAAMAFLVVYMTKNFFYNGMIVEGYSTAAQCWVLVLSKVPATIFNGAVAVIFAPILGTAIQKALRTAKLDRLLS